MEESPPAESGDGAAVVQAPAAPAAIVEKASSGEQKHDSTKDKKSPEAPAASGPEAAPEVTAAAAAKSLRASSDNCYNDIIYNMPA